jgi:hypothetical protein
MDSPPGDSPFLSNEEKRQISERRHAEYLAGATWKIDQQTREFADAKFALKRGDPSLMEQFTHLWSRGDAWWELYLFYLCHRPDDQRLATDACRNALQCKYWFQLGLSGTVQKEYDDRRFLGIGATQDFHELTKEWTARDAPRPMDGREFQLAWIFTYGPADLVDLQRAYWWFAMGRRNWGLVKDNDIKLPTHSIPELCDHLIASVPNDVRERIEKNVEEAAYADFVCNR